MARFCVVAPPQILATLNNVDQMGNSHLLLAHDVVHKDKRETYRELFHPESKGIRTWGWHPERKRNALIILDNSIIELGNAVSPEIIADAFDIVKPTCVVLPDVLLRPDDTIDSCMAALQEWPKYFPRGTKWMMVPQGCSKYEMPREDPLKAFTRCAEKFAMIPEISHWGVPRNLVKQIGSRKKAIQILHCLNPNRHLHMFGFSDDLIDDITCANYLEVRSIDSAVPLRLLTPMSLLSEIGPRGDWWEQGVCTQQTIENLARIRQLIGF